MYAKPRRFRYSGLITPFSLQPVPPHLKYHATSLHSPARGVPKITNCNFWYPALPGNAFIK